MSVTSAKTTLRTLIFLQVVAFLLIIVAAAAGPTSRDYPVPQTREEAQLQLTLAYIVLGGLVLASIAVVFFWSFAPAFYSIVIIVALGVTGMRRISVESGWTQAAEGLFNVVNGMILAMIFFSPARELFGAKNSTATLPPVPAPIPFPAQPANPSPAPQAHVAASPAPVYVTCPACNAQTFGSKFCPQCGVPQQPVKLTCVSCGAQYLPGTRFCPECGRPVG